MYWAIAAFGLGFMVALIMYNHLVSCRNQADSSFSTIDVMLKKRWDLIPNLVAVAKGYMRHEASLLEQMAALRSTALASPVQSQTRMAAEGQLSRALHQFQARVENYPDLKASEQFLQLQAALNECEEQHQSLFDDACLSDYAEQIRLCLSVVEELGLNTRIWGKQ